jgi:hypothetical protein
MRFLGTQDIALRAEKDALELNIQKAGMSGAEKRDPQSVAKMRQRLSEIYTRLDPAKAVKEQVKANQGTRFNPAMGDYDPLNMNLQTAMALVDRKYGNQPGYLKSRDQVKYSIQNQLSGGTPIDSASVVGRARDELTKATKKDPGGAKAATLESRRNLVDAQKTKASDLEGMTNPYDIAMTLMDLQNQGGMDRPIGGGMANRPNISPYGNSLPAQAMAAAGMVTDQMRPSESIPSTQGILGKEKGVQVDAFIKSLGSMFDPAQLATPITGAADMADMAFRALDPVARQQVEKELKGATKEEQDTFIARMLGMLTGGIIQGKIGAKLSSRLKSAADRPLPAPLEEALTNMAANQGTKRNFLPEIATKTNPDQIGLAQAASMKRPVKSQATPAPKSSSAPAYSIDAPEKLYHGSPSKFSQLKDQPLYFTSEYPGQTRKYSELGGRGSNRQFEPLFVDEQGVVYERQPNDVWAAKWDSGEDGELVPLPESARSSIPNLTLDDVERLQRNWVGGGMAPEAYRYETKGSGKLLNLVREEKPGDSHGFIRGDSQAIKDVIGTLDPQGNSLAQTIIEKARKEGYFDWQDTTMLSESWASTRNGRLQTEAWNIISSQLKEKGYSGIRFADDGSVTTALLDKPTFSSRTELRSKVNEPIATPADFTVGQEIKVPKKNGSEVAAKVTDVTDVSVGIETAAGVKKFYSPEDAKAILKPQEQPVQAKATPMATQLAPEDILVHPDIQFRGKAKSSEMVIDKTGNVTTKLKSVDAYNKTQGGSLLVWESNTGKRFVVDGHHRLELAKRATRFVDDTPEGQIDVPREIPVNVIREADGWSLNEAQFKGLMANLRDQKADPLDAALILRKRGITPDQIDGFFTKEGVTVSAARSKEIKGTMGLSVPAFERAMGSYDVNQQSVAGLGSIDGLTPEQQLAAIGILEKGDHNTFKEGAVIAQKIKDRGAGTVTKAADEQMGFGDMFGDGGPDPFADYLSTIGTEATLQKMAEGQITKKFRDLNAPLNADLLEGEFINADLRGALKDKLGGSQSKARGKVDILFDLDKNFQRYVSEQAQKVMNGNVSEDQAAKEIAQAAIDKIGSPDFEREFVRGLVQPSPDSGSNGGLPPGPPDAGGVPGSPDAGGPKRVNPKQRRQAGKTDPKTLGAAAGAALTGAAFYFKDDINKAIEENDLEDIRNTLIKAGIGTALATVLFDKGRGAVIGATKNSFDPFRVILDPRSVEKLSATGPFKSSLADVLTVNDLYKLKTAKAMINVEKTAKDVFGKNPGKNPVYKEWNTKYRDHVEQNIANGKKWDDGVPEDFAKFAKSAIKEMDTMLDEWEKLGGRIKVANNGLQQTKMEIGASIKLATGEWAEYQGFSKLKDGAVKLQVEVVNAAGKKVLRDIAPGEEFGRPVYRMGEAYVPRIYTRSFIEQLLKGDDTFKSALSDAVVKAGGDPLSDAEFTSLKDMARGFAETEAATDINSFMGNLQKERQLQFAKFEYTTPDGKKVVVDPYENSYFDAVRKYTDRAAKRVAVAQVLGVESDVLAKVIDGVRGVDYDGANYLTSLVGNLLDLGPKAPDQRNWMSKLARKEGQYQAVTKLLGGTSAISQFADIIIPLTEFGPVTVGRAIQKLVKDPTFKSDIDAFNGGTQAWVKEMTGVENTGGKAEIATAKFIDTGMAVVLLKQMDKTMKRVNTASVVTEVERIGKKIEAGQNLTGPETRAIERLGLAKWQDSIKSVGLEKTMAKERFQADIAGHAKTFQYSGATEDLPLWMSHPAGAMAMRFKKPWYVATKTLMQGALNEASQGNFTPFARAVAYSVTVGAGAQYMKDIIKMSGLDDETRTLLMEALQGKDAGKFGEAIKRMFVDAPLEKNYLAQGIRNIREEKAGALMQLFGLVGQTIYESGSSGIAGEVLPINQRSQSDVRRFDSFDSFKPISVQSALRGLGMGGAMINKMGGTLTPEKANADIYEAFRSEVIPARRVFDLFNAKPDEVRAREDARKIKIENAKVPKDLPTKERNQILEGVATPEKVRRSIRNSIKSGKKLKL